MEVTLGNLITIGAMIVTSVSFIWAIRSSVSGLKADNGYTRQAIERLTHAIEHLDSRGDDHEVRLVRLEERENASRCGGGRGNAGRGV